MNKYRKTNELEVYLLLRGISLDPFSCGYGISTREIARSLSTSLYQTAKHLKLLQERGAAGLQIHRDVCTCHEHCECEATGLTWKSWIFKKDLTKYKEHNEHQSRLKIEFKW